MPVGWVVMVAVLGVCSAAWWYLLPSGHAPLTGSAANSAQLVQLPVPLPSHSPGVVPVPVAAAIPATPENAETANGVFTLKMDTRARLAPHLFQTDNPAAKVNADAGRPAVTPAMPVAAAPVANTVSATEPVVANSPVLASASAVASPAAAALATPNPSTQRQAAAAEALSQAQTLWTAGSRDAAIELMREALTVAERNAAPGGSAMLVSMVRELARMELAEGQAARVLDMLTRLEPAIAGRADLWAVRGNAAQRLGRHQESANAYMHALRLRPEEPRWMLGAAVSLAAQGQTTEAADLAEKARAGGAVSREVAAYLRQLGVPLRDQ